jgi:hypothetical protein
MRLEHEALARSTLNVCSALLYRKIRSPRAPVGAREPSNRNENLPPRWGEPGNGTTPNDVLGG